MTSAFVVRVTPAFERQLKKLSPRHPGLVATVAALQDDPQNRRNTHNIKKIDPKRYRISDRPVAVHLHDGRPGGVVDLLRAQTRGHVSVMDPLTHARGRASSALGPRGPVCGQPDRRGLFRRGRPVRRSSCRFSCRRSDSGSTTFPPRRTSGNNGARRVIVSTSFTSSR